MDFNKAISKLNNMGVSAYEIHKSTGLNEAGVRRVLRGEVENPQRKTKDTILKFISDLGNAIESNTNDSEKTEGVPYFDIDFTAGFMEVFNSNQLKPDSYIAHPFFSGCDYVVRAFGQSMAKILKHGDAIGLIIVNDWQNFLPFGEVYAIVTNSGLRLIKVVTAGSNKNTFTLISKPTDSKREEFPPQEIEKNLIKSVFKVQATSSLF